MVPELSGNSALVYHEDYLRYDFGRSHPLRPVRYKLTVELMKALNILSPPRVTVVKPQPARFEDLVLFHAEEYVKMVEKVSQHGFGMLDMGDTPAFKGCYDVTRLKVGGSLRAVDLVMAKEVDHAFNIGGGLHHAHRDHASGFCIFNDPAICVAYLKEKYGLKRIMYLDIDAHHGDGVMYGYYSDPCLLDIDFHESGRYLFPGTGFTYEVGEGAGEGYKVNVSLPPYTYDQAYLHTFHEVVPPLVRSYKPEIILMQCGVDGHFDDLLTDLGLTTAAYLEVISKVHDLAHEVTGGRLVLLGGGGYNMSNVARCWAIMFGTVAGVELSNQLPSDWKDIYMEMAGEKPPETLKDEKVDRDKGRDEEILGELKQMVRDLEQRIPLFSKS